jgi:cellulose synthase (UDP-forming)
MRFRALAGGASAITAALRGLAVAEFVGQTFVAAALTVVGILLLAAVIVTPLGFQGQAAFAILTVAAMVILRGNRSRGATLVLVVLSIIVSTRYIFWRLSQTLPLPIDQSWDLGTIVPAFLGIGLVLAELYAWFALLLGYVQTSCPLERQPVALPDDWALWPTVDLFITTYNEPLAIVRNTVFGALSLDYPAGKLRLHLLDDGHRQAFRDFAAAVGVNYITRTDNLHAKAGNLNNALHLTNGDLIALFDADHVPTRAFLQLTVGGFLTDGKLAVVQTPHHFYSPDPFERNLDPATAVPGEGQLFYGLIQPGNDLWNAAFFCGSCGVIRRAVLEAVGGFATDSVTEDAHTALRIHRAGWNSAYLRLPLAAGLATERLALHVGQRMRWARGMTQIFRLDNPLLGPGLSVGQRICYLNAMLHFFFSVPRLVFLTAPIVYLLFQVNLIVASAPMIIAYAGPHLLHVSVTNSRLQSRFRHSYWGEIYECVLAFHLLRTTLATLIDPRNVRFNVTEKGGLVREEYFDYKMVRPSLVIGGLLILALLVAALRFFLASGGDANPAVLALNVGWAVFNLVLLGAAVAVGRETRQLRTAARRGLVLPAIIHLASGRTIVTQSQNMSTTGARLASPFPREGCSVRSGDWIDIEFADEGWRTILPARVVSWQGDGLRVAFDGLTLRQHRDLVRIVLCRADAWLDWEDHAADRPLRAAWEVFTSLRGLFGRKPGGASAANPVLAPPAAAGATLPQTAPRRGVAALRVGVALAFAVLAVTTPGEAQPARPGLLPSPPFGRAPPAVLAPALPPPLVGDPRPAPSASPLRPDLPARQFAPGVPPGRNETSPDQPTISAPAAPPNATAQGGSTRRDIYSLRDLGAYSPIRLAGVQGETSLPLSIRRDEVVTAAKIVLSFAYSPALIPELSHLVVLLNGEVVGSVALPKEKHSADTAEFEINPAFFQDNNRLSFRFIGHYAQGCEDPLHTSLWLVLSNLSLLQLQIERLPLQNDLALLPLPFFDRRDMKPLTLPFVFSGHPSLATLQAAGTVASWFGSLAERGASFPAALGEIPDTNAVVFATASDKSAPLPVRVDGPTIAVVTNPHNPQAKLLLVLGRTDAELRAAARTLALGSVALSGETQIVGAPDIAPRKPYDAPRWIPIDRPVRFGELASPTHLQGNGLQSGMLTLNFRTAPDLFTWLNPGVPLDIRYRYPVGTWLDYRASRLDVSINNSYLRSLPLTQQPIIQRVKDMLMPDFIVHQQSMRLPPYYIFGQNQLQFYFDLKPQTQSGCQDTLPSHIEAAIDPDSTIDLSHTQHFTSLPNLAFFANSGFPFTRLADLSGTAVILPDQPTAPDIEAFLTLMGLMGKSTGYPVTGSTVLTPALIDQAGDKDIIVLGAIPDQPLLGRWAANANLRLDGGRLRLRLRVSTPLRRMFTALDPAAPDSGEQADQLLLSQGDDLAAMIGMQSPLRAGRSAVLITGSRPENLMTVLRTFDNRELAPLIQGDLMLANGDRVTSFRVGREYAVGYLPLVTRIRWWLSNSPLIFLSFAAVGVLIVALMAYRLFARRAAARAGPRQVP